MFGFGKKKIEFVAPFDGNVVPVSEVPDPMFAGKMLGDGYAVIPSDDAEKLTVVAPAEGTLVKVFKTGHAFSMKTTAGVEVLVHIGLETVELKGEGFTVLHESGSVTAGTPIVEVDLSVVRGAGLNPITIVVFTKKGQVAELAVNAGATGAQPAAIATIA
ncbi:MAG: PTS glucose transporter subunit IIA [Actinomycetaceae bacterium]|nr:PTS glucose transporter subunit IIA [Actinomycetaceae bacterium]MDY5855376.1 PTS glucose transporter subunit IIA [Arcanobacterium sp.]